jgi:hypothetical protein
LNLCGKRDRWSIAYRHPGGHRTSNMLDRLMRGMNRYFDQGQHLHGSLEACRLHCRAWALLCNFTPWHPMPLTGFDRPGLELLSAQGLESALLEAIALQNETVSCHPGKDLRIFPSSPR